MIEICPECGAPGVPLIYGLPDPALGRAARDGWLALAGRMLSGDGDDPDWRCPARHEWRDDDLSGRERLVDEIVATYANGDRDGVDRVTIRGGASTLQWSDDGRALTIVTPGAPDEVARFSPRTQVGGFEFVVSRDEQYVALFIYSGQSSQGYELFALRPTFTHIGGMPETPGHGSPPMFSPDSSWLAMFMDGEYLARGTDDDFEELYDERSDARAVLDWACLHVLHLPSRTLTSVDIGVEMPLSTDPDVYYGWETYGAARFASGDVVVLRMPWGAQMRVPLPPEGAVTALDGPADAPVEEVTRRPLTMTVQPDGRTFIAEGTYLTWGSVRTLLDAAPHSADEVTALAVTVDADGRQLLAGALPNGVRLWDLATGATVGDPLHGQTDRVAAIAAVTLPEGQRVLVTGGNAGSLGLWDSATGRPVRDPITGRTSEITAMAAVPMPDGRTLLATAAGNGMIRLRDPATADPVGAELNRAGARILSMTVLPTPDGRHLIATAEGRFQQWNTSRGGQVRLWDPTRTQSATGTPGGPTDGRLARVGQDNVVAVDTVALGGLTLLVTAGDNGSIALWNPADGDLVGEPLAPHTDANSVTAMTVATTPFGRALIVTGSPDRRCLNIWDPAVGSLWELHLDVAVNALAAAGPHVAVAHDGGALIVSIADPRTTDEDVAP